MGGRQLLVARLCHAPPQAHAEPGPTSSFVRVAWRATPAASGRGTCADLSGYASGDQVRCWPGSVTAPQIGSRPRRNIAFPIAVMARPIASEEPIDASAPGYGGAAEARFEPRANAQAAARLATDHCPMQAGNSRDRRLERRTSGPARRTFLIPKCRRATRASPPCRLASFMPSRRLAEPFRKERDAIGIVPAANPAITLRVTFRRVTSPAAPAASAHLDYASSRVSSTSCSSVAPVSASGQASATAIHRLSSAITAFQLLDLWPNYPSRPACGYRVTIDRAAPRRLAGEWIRCAGAAYSDCARLRFRYLNRLNQSSPGERLFGLCCRSRDRPAPF